MFACLAAQIFQSARKHPFDSTRFVNFQASRDTRHLRLTFQKTSTIFLRTKCSTRPGVSFCALMSKAQSFRISQIGNFISEGNTIIEVTSVAFQRHVLLHRLFDAVTYFASTRLVASPSLQFHSQIFVFHGPGLGLVYAIDFPIETGISNVITPFDIATCKLVEIVCVHRARTM